jgi:hypothetical protein
VSGATGSSPAWGDNFYGEASPPAGRFTEVSSGAATSKGYTATAARTDYWVAIYNGDSTDKWVSSGTGDEPLTVQDTVKLLYKSSASFTGDVVRLWEGSASL